MKTRSSDPQLGHGLPPPPAPPARDANPWQMSSGARGARYEPRHPRAPGWPPQPDAARPDPVGRSPRTPWIPVLVLFAILGSGVQLAIRALGSGEVEKAIGALLIFAVVAVVGLRRLLKRKTQ